MDIWVSAAWFLIALVAMILFRRWIEMHLQGFILLMTGHQGLAVWIFFLLFFPGILVHELSHWLMAKLLFVPTGRITIWPKVNRDGSVWLGTVEVGQTDTIRGSLIGLAPLISGSAIAVLIGMHLQLGGWGNALLALDLPLLSSAIGSSLTMPDFWLWLYLLFAIANRMLPSPSDREPWKPVVVLLAIVAVVWIASGWTPQLPVEVEQLIAELGGFLIYAFSVTAAIDMAVICLLAGVEGLLGLLLQRRVSYRSR